MSDLYGRQLAIDTIIRVVKYVDNCVDRIFKKPKKRKDRAAWPKHVVEYAKCGVAECELFGGYNFEE